MKALVKWKEEIHIPLSCRWYRRLNMREGNRAVYVVSPSYDELERGREGREEKRKASFSLENNQEMRAFLSSPFWFHFLLHVYHCLCLSTIFHFVCCCSFLAM